jgi:hypothetical protein
LLRRKKQKPEVLEEDCEYIVNTWNDLRGLGEEDSPLPDKYKIPLKLVSAGFYYFGGVERDRCHVRGESNGGVPCFSFLKKKQASRVQRSYKRSELEKAGRFLTGTVHLVSILSDLVFIRLCYDNQHDYQLFSDAQG